MIRIIKHLLTPKIIRLLAVLYTVAIVFGSLIKTQTVHALQFDLSDKAIHVIAYFFLTCIWFLSFFQKKILFFKTIFIVTCFVFLFGIIIELLQETFSEDRQADFYDVVANFAGILIAVILIISLKKMLFRLKFKN